MPQPAQPDDPASRATFRWDPAEEIDTPADRLAETLAQKFPGIPPALVPQIAAELVASTGHTTPHAPEITARLIQLFGQFSQSSAIISRCVALVYGLSTFPETTETAIAERYGLTRSTISAIAVKLRKLLDFEHCPGLRDQAARAKCADRQRGRRARPVPRPWPFSAVLQNAINISKTEARFHSDTAPAA